MNKISEFLAISASIIQCTGIGPVSYFVNASDLKAIFLLNKIMLMIGTYLLVLASQSHTIQNEPHAIESWFKDNNLTLNTKQSIEIIICRPKSRNANLPPAPIPGIQRVDQIVVLGIIVRCCTPLWWGFIVASYKQRLQSM